jgi:hypothetical protein
VLRRATPPASISRWVVGRPSTAKFVFGDLATRDVEHAVPVTDTRL